MINVQGLSKRYGDAVAVRSLTFNVGRGRVTGFLGPNGAGKSTTMRMMLGLDRPTAGRVLFDGRPYRDLREPLRHVGSLLEAKTVHSGRTAEQHLRWVAASNRIPSARIPAVLDLVGLGPIADRRIHRLSLGLGQRLGLATALLGDPPVLLLDEPVNGLDPEGIVWIRTLLKGLAAEGRTVFVSSHLMAEMAMTAAHLVIIAGGRLVADATVGEVVRNAGAASLEEAFLRLVSPRGAA